MEEKRKKECMSFLLFGCAREKKKKMNAVEWCFFHGIHCFVISSIWAEIGGRESKNFIESTTLYNKMTNTSLTFLRYMNFLIIHKGTMIKICIFPFFSFCKPNKGKIEFSYILLPFLSYIQTHQSEIFSSLSFLLFWTNKRACIFPRVEGIFPRHPLQVRLFHMKMFRDIFATFFWFFFLNFILSKHDKISIYNVYYMIIDFFLWLNIN